MYNDQVTFFLNLWTEYSGFKKYSLNQLNYLNWWHDFFSKQCRGKYYGITIFSYLQLVSIKEKKTKQREHSLIMLILQFLPGAVENHHSTDNLIVINIYFNLQNIFSLSLPLLNTILFTWLFIIMASGIWRFFWRLSYKIYPSSLTIQDISRNLVSTRLKSSIVMEINSIISHLGASFSTHTYMRPFAIVSD